ncbi:MAG TPA: HNH endonuclease signature motif containing protein, partial [Anaeromyxobacteraceae bacterium]|nr:HNH endonuclease signature motif containing protein [Anaeromyxobacteraceae bacterium]
PRFFGLSRQDAEALVASIRPAEVIPTREVVTAVRPPAADRALALAVEAPALLPADQCVSPGETAPAPATALGTPPVRALPPGRPLPPAPPPRAAVEPLDAEVARLHLTVTRRLLEKLEAARDALGHSIPTGDAAAIIERGLDLVLAEHAKRQGLVDRPQQKRRPSRPDHVPAAVKRQVWRRAGGRCEFVLESGERCGCTGRLQYDHIRPTALGGPSTVENVRLVCAAHNLIAARRVFGDAKVDRYGRCRRPSTLAAQAPLLLDAIPAGSNPVRAL